MRNPELLAPAGNWEKLEVAIRYGADAVYLAGEHFNLRQLGANFSLAQMQQAICMAHGAGVKVYVACNSFARTHELQAIERFLIELGRMRVDGVIIADPGVIMAARQLIPDIPIHLSTQANTTNAHSARFWASAGVKRINAARELSLPEIRQLADARAVEVEAFVHGAMCMAYSGRCLLSHFLTGRDSNRGHCSHPCRWRYQVVEQKRPGQYLPISQDNRGAHIFYSRDLCMIEHIRELMDAGVCALKIEGRMKGIHYLALTIKAYRAAIDAACDDLPPPPHAIELTESLNSRGYTTGFYFGLPADNAINPSPTHQISRRFLGKIIDTRPDSSQVLLQVRNPFACHDTVQVISPGNHPAATDRIVAIAHMDGRRVEQAHPGMEMRVELAHRRHQKLDLICQPCGDTLSEK